MKLSSANSDQPNVPAPSFADFKFKVIGQLPNLLKRMGTPSSDFRHSPTPMDMDLEYPSRSETPWTGTPTHTPLQGRLSDSANYSTWSSSDGLYLPMTIMDDSQPEQKPTIGSQTPITTFPLAPNTMAGGVTDGTSIISATGHTTSSIEPSTSNSPVVAVAQAMTTHTPTPPPLPFLTPPKPEETPLTYTISTQQLQYIQSAWALSYESALIAFEKAERSLASAQETYDATKAALAAITRAREPLTQPPTTDKSSQPTSDSHPPDISDSASPKYHQMTNTSDPRNGSLSQNLISQQSVPVAPQHPIPTPDSPHPSLHVRLNAVSAEKRELNRRMFELEQEADDVRRAWSISSVQQPSVKPYAPTTKDDKHTYQDSTISSQTPVEGLTGPSHVPQSTEARDSTRLGKRRRFESTSPPMPEADKLITTPSRKISTISNPPNTNFSSVSALPRAANDAPTSHFTQAPMNTSKVAPCNTTILQNPHDQHAPKAILPVSSVGPLNLKQEGSADDEDFFKGSSFEKSMSFSPPADYVSSDDNEMEVEKELGREGSTAWSPPSSSRGTPLTPAIVAEPVIGDAAYANTGLRAEGNPAGEEEDEEENRIHVPGAGSSTPQESDLERPQHTTVVPLFTEDDSNTTSGGALPLLQRLQPAPIAPVADSPEPPSQRPTTPSASLPVLGKRRHSPYTTQSPVSPHRPKRRTFDYNVNPSTSNAVLDPPTINDNHVTSSLAARMGDSIDEPEQPTVRPTFTHPRGAHHGHNRGYKPFVPYRGPAPHAERSATPPSGPRAAQAGHHKYGPQSRPSLDISYSPDWDHSVPAIDRALGAGPDHYSKFRNKVPYWQSSTQEGAPSGAARDIRPFGRARGGIHGSYYPSKNSWDRNVSANHASQPRSDMRPPARGPEYRTQESSLLKRIDVDPQ
ncbi:hypothetical protein DXG01_014742 [Tephrocybe rancida]|nr:hypothetical protein DXG01_014742 [Tephrocybe rancida]